MTAIAPPWSIYQSWRPSIDHTVSRARAAYRIQPFYVTSWWRSFPENRRVRGEEYSQHLIATGFDAAPQYGTVAQLAANLSRAGFYVVPYARHVHAQLHAAGFLERWANP